MTRAPAREYLGLNLITIALLSTITLVGHAVLALKLAMIPPTLNIMIDLLGLSLLSLDWTNIYKHKDLVTLRDNDKHQRIVFGLGFYSIIRTCPYRYIYIYIVWVLVSWWLEWIASNGIPWVRRQFPIVVSDVIWIPRFEPWLSQSNDLNTNSWGSLTWRKPLRLHGLMISKYFKTKPLLRSDPIIQLRYWCTHLLIGAAYKD